MMTPDTTEVLIAALAEGMHDCGWNEMCAGNKGATCDSCNRVAREQAESLTPEARDAMLLGFTLNKLLRNGTAPTLIAALEALNDD